MVIPYQITYRYQFVVLHQNCLYHLHLPLPAQDISRPPTLMGGTRSEYVRSNRFRKNRSLILTFHLKTGVL
jgi:hypothetical protein